MDQITCTDGKIDQPEEEAGEPVFTVSYHLPMDERMTLALERIAAALEKLAEAKE